MTIVRIFSKKWFRQKVNLAIRQAGPRYSPQVNVDLPINKIFTGLGRTEEFYAEFSNLREEFVKKWQETSIKRDFKGLHLEEKSFSTLSKNVEHIISFLDNLKEATFQDIDFAFLEKKCKQVSDAVFLLDSTLTKEAEKSEKVDSTTKATHPNATDRLKHFIHEVRQLRELVYKVGNVAASSFAEVSNKGALLLLGEAGVGKTHLFCDIAEARIKRKLPTILILGQQLQSVKDPLETIIGELKVNLTKKQFLVRLNSMARYRKKKIIILIDAINEGDRHGWKKGLNRFLEELKGCRGIAVALSCRVPFDKVTIPKRTKAIREYHYGFAEHELDALKIYTAHYKLPLPEIPILTPEFSNPLFLKLFCESLEKAVVKKRHKQIQEISSGQKGMTNIIEDIIVTKSEKIGKQFRITPKAVWQIVKEDFASSMVRGKRSWLSLPEAKIIIAKYVGNNAKRNQFLRALICENLLWEDVFYDPTKKTHSEVVRFPYQKFSDHIIARHLLTKAYFDKQRINESISDENRLGWLFKDDNAINANSGIIEAVIVEFPNRIGNKGELFDYLPNKDKGISGELVELFINGLYWRDAGSFNNSTNKWVSCILKHENMREKVLDVLVALATKPKHPYNAYRLYNYLKRFAMHERDLAWSEFLRGQTESNTVYKLLNWVESFGIDKISEDYAEMYIVLLCWFLTSTNRPLRDKATRGLYILGKRYPWLLFKKTLISLEINDPYVPERMFAASYGVVMALHYNSGIPDFTKKYLAWFAKQIFGLIFAKGAKFGTTHILMRDYAKHIIDIALLHEPALFSIKEKHLVNPPFKYGGIRRWGESEDLDKDKYRNGNAPMHMDFENYTLGRLVDSRSNYDFEHEGYKKIRANIFWRIYNLGYSHEAFKKIDSEIAQFNWNRSEHIKVDRYGKKYCWIAFYELAGFREDNGLLPEKYGGRISDTDIDPSFPSEPNIEEIIKSDYIGDRSLAVNDWIEKGSEPDLAPYLRLKKISNQKGPWVLLDGFIMQEDLESKRDIFVFTRGFFVSSLIKDELLRAMQGLEYPGNGRLPDAESDYYTFAGEIPWCSTFPYTQYKKEITIPTGEKTITREKIEKPTKVIVLNFGDKKKMRIPDYSEKDLSKGYIEREQENILNFEVELPVRSFNWESGRSIVNPGPHAYVPTKEICEYLNLTSRPQTFDMYDSDGKIASVTCRFGDAWHTGHKLIYLRQDLLSKYLKDKKLFLIWVIWGERRFHVKDEGELRKFAEKHKSYQVYKYVTVYNN